MGSKPRQRLTRDQIARMVQMANDSDDRAGVAAGFGVSRTTLIKYVRLVAEQPWIYRQRPMQRGRDMTWIWDAKCCGLRSPDGAYFTEWPVRNQISVCHGCPVRLQCLEYGLEDTAAGERRSSEGRVYGGLSPKQLAEMQRQRAVAS